jgi:hypothetical protein
MKDVGYDITLCFVKVSDREMEDAKIKVYVPYIP